MTVEQVGSPVSNLVESRLQRVPRTNQIVKTRPTAIDLFAGPGGLTQGLVDAGFNVLGAVEIDPLAVQTYKLNHRNVVVFEDDIKMLEPLGVLQTLGIGRGSLGVLAACPPCQGFSSTRTLNGSRNIDDSRKDLVGLFGDWVEVIQPRAVLLENVPGLERDSRFADLLARFTAMGYNTENTARVLNAADYGVPQRRRRLVVMGMKNVGLEFAVRSDDTRTVRDAIGSLPSPGRTDDIIHEFPERRSDHVRRIIRTIPKDGGSRSSLSDELTLACHKKTNGFKDVYGRMAWDKPAPTITGGCSNPSKGRFLHPVEDRNITMREAALLQGFPEGYEFATGRGKGAVAQMIGNAVPPPFVASHARVLRRALAETQDEGGNS